MAQLGTNLRFVELSAVVELLSSVASTGRMRVTCGSRCGEITLRNGEIVAASLGDERGLTALEDITVGFLDGELSFATGPVAEDAQPLLPLDEQARWLRQLDAERARFKRRVSALVDAGAPRIEAVAAVPTPQSPLPADVRPMRAPRGRVMSARAPAPASAVQQPRPIQRIAVAAPPAVRRIAEPVSVAGPKTAPLAGWCAALVRWLQPSNKPSRRTSLFEPLETERARWSRDPNSRLPG